MCLLAWLSSHLTHDPSITTIFSISTYRQVKNRPEQWGFIYLPFGLEDLQLVLINIFILLFDQKIYWRALGKLFPVIKSLQQQWYFIRASWLLHCPLPTWIQFRAIKRNYLNRKEGPFKKMSHDGARWENLLQLELSENIFPGTPWAGIASTVRLDGTGGGRTVVKLYSLFGKI